MNREKNKRYLCKKLILGIVIAITMTTTTGCGDTADSAQAQPNTKNTDHVTQIAIEGKTGEKDVKTEGMEAEQEAIDAEENAKPPIENPIADVTPEAEAAKPILAPESLSADQLYAAYNNTLIIGDSRTEGFKMYSGVKNASYFCMKAMTIDKIVDGKTVNVNGRAVSVYDILEAGTYDKIIIGVGLNELGWNHIETFLNDYGTLIDKIKDKQPNGVIYLQAVLPVAKAKNDSDKTHNNAQIFWYNENIIKLAETKSVQYVNPAGALVNEDGFLLEEATTDGVHLTSAYCKVWAEYLAQLI